MVQQEFHSLKFGLCLAGLAIALTLVGCRPATIDEHSVLASNRLMAGRLRLLAANSRPLRNVYLNQARADHFAALESPTDPSGQAKATLRTAREELRAGRTEAAISRLEGALKFLDSDLPELRRQLHSLLALAYLRLGEQQNCIADHTSASCLAPIAAEGFHRRQGASRRALAELTTLLREDPDDLDARWLLNLAAMTVGEYPQGVAEPWRIDPAVFASTDDIGRFHDVAADAGVAAFGLAGGVVVEDLDGDGHLDILTSSWGLLDPLRFFRNRGDDAGQDRLAFEERTASAGLSGLGGGLNLIHADYDNDGLADILVLRGAWLGPEGRHPNSLLHNLGGRFEEVTVAAGLLSFHPTQTAAWGDFDHDGWLDLMIGNESLGADRHPCELYRNNRDGTFTEIAAQVGAAVVGYVKGVVWGDYDNDGWLDLYLTRMLEPNLLLHNEAAADGGRRFREVTAEAGVGEPRYSFPTWFFDYDNDGWLDLLVAAYDAEYLAAGAANVAADYLGTASPGETPRLYHNNRDGTFSDRTQQAGLDKVLYAMGSGFGDLDNDGWLDFYVGTGAPDLRAIVPNRMFLNHGDGRFGEVTTAGGFGHLQKGHAVAFGDLDGDGDQDLYAVLGGAYSGDGFSNALFENPGHGQHWITLRLEGVRENRSAIGVRLRLELATPSGPRQVHATVGTGGSFGSSSLQQEIGLGEATALSEIEVWWPASDSRQTFHQVAMDQIWYLREGDPLRTSTAGKPGAGR